MISLRKFLEMSKEEMSEYLISSGFYDNIQKLLPREEMQVLDSKEILGILSCSWRWRLERVFKKSHSHGITGIGYYFSKTHEVITLAIFRHISPSSYVISGYVSINTAARKVIHMLDGTGNSIISLSHYNDAFDKLL